MAFFGNARFGSARRNRAVVAAALAAVLVATSACTSGSGGADEVTLLTHDSFELPQNLIDRFEKQTGTELKIVRSGDAGQLSSVVSLTPGSPKGDAVFGIDNTFAARPIEAKALDPYTSPAAVDGSAKYDIQGAPGQLTAVDRGDVCLNVDDAWFDKHGIEAPTSLEQLTQPRYRDMAALLDPSTSSPGMGFLLTTIGRFKGGVDDYWRGLVDNGAQIVSGWEVAYNQLFSAGAGHGDKPIVVSYASSPAATPGTSALLNACFAQVEYIGVLRGAANTAGARKLVDFMLTPEVQAALPTAMYVYPVQKDIPLPADWRQRAPMPAWTVTMSPEYIDAHREQWLNEWRATVKR
ncbi:thiamine ABC transporter substrate binding subunit [Gordonia sp. PS3]|uniref:Putative ABC transporter substrate-binding protein n=1 Tax=Gordonia sihwensis NBRC 108236 TaxID=1223544 RepID=L7LKA4_9ACTN|nr:MULTISPECIES: thiamine ABC transporter substrate-binding protein [Gordonia]AUH68365.1 thiamine ABC transporter substrate-binding protein [Gordonia sp. YC-JH1]KJR02546.1 ABC transporter substrate-binding protein [Gordonia sihwensis]KXT57675.1 ABC transporter substrate-binding protein [Gordonia sp. QH-12]MBY4570920.1 thiamine ABC transporter substrate-binding protein [Gordonia sihwensis]WFN91859.1 thiamine ABC transporter substrate-binding protein [Gordonia sihwensis]